MERTQKIKDACSKNRNRLGAVTHACYPSSLGGQGRRLTCQEIKIILANMVKPHSLLKIEKLAGCGGACL